MPIPLNLEQMEDKWLAHIPNFWGCFGKFDDPQEALQGMHPVLESYLGWLAKHNLPFPSEEMLGTGTDAFQFQEIIRSWHSPAEPAYEVNAFFASDAIPLQPDELPTLQASLTAVLKDLTYTYNDLSAEKISQEIEGSWNVAHILKHLVRAGSWYLSLAGVAPAASHTDDPLAAMQNFEAHLLNSIPSLVERTVVSVDLDEQWSARKVMRRTFWHLRDHTQQIIQIRQKKRF